MSEKTSFRDWLGFKGADDTAPSSVERIRELESQLADLQSRRDITSLTQEEFEILATETAMSMIKSAQMREAKAKSLSDRILNESARQAKSTIEDAEHKAKVVQETAEAHGQKFVQDAEVRANSLITAGKTQAAQLAETAQREGERLIKEATNKVGEYRQWLAGVVAETERHHKVQLQSLAGAEKAIQQSRAQLESAFDQLNDLKMRVTSQLNSDDSFARPTLVQVADAVEDEAAEGPSAPTISILSAETAKRAVKRTADSPK